MSNISDLKDKIRQQPDDSLTLIHNGYIYLKIHSCEYKTIDGWILEHRLKAQRVLGRKLKTSEHVHHIDMNKLNNSIENLCVMKAERHTRFHRRLRAGKSPDLGRYVKDFLVDMPKIQKKSKKIKARKLRRLEERMIKKEEKRQALLRRKEQREELLKTPKKAHKDQSTLPHHVEVFTLKSKHRT